MKLYELNDNKPLFVMYVKSNPPTNVYGKFFDYLKRISRGNHRVFINSVIDTELNPLPFDKALYFNKQVFSGVKFDETNNIKNIHDVIDTLKDETNVVFVVSQDEVKEYKDLKEYANDVGIASFDVIPAQNIKDTSNEESYEVLQYIKDNDYSEYKKMIPNTNELVLSQLFLEVRKRMLGSPKDSKQKDESVDNVRIVGDLLECLSNKFVYESLPLDKFKNKVFECDSLLIVECKHIDKVSLGNRKTDNKQTLLVPSMNRKSLYECVTSSNIASSPLLFKRSVGETEITTKKDAPSLFSGIEIPLFDEELFKQSITVYDYMRDFVNKYGRINKEIIRRYYDGV